MSPIELEALTILAGPGGQWDARTSEGARLDRGMGLLVERRVAIFWRSPDDSSTSFGKGPLFQAAMMVAKLANKVG